MGGVASNADFDRQSGEIAVILRARADAGLYCGAAVKTFSDWNCEFVIVGRKTERLLGELQLGDWQPSPDGHADFECQFRYRPEGWDREYPFVGRRYEEPEPDAENPDQIGRFDGLACRYLGGAVDNLIKESNNHHRTIATTRLRLRYPVCGRLSETWMACCPLSTRCCANRGLCTVPPSGAKPVRRKEGPKGGLSKAETPSQIPIPAHPPVAFTARGAQAVPVIHDLGKTPSSACVFCFLAIRYGMSPLDTRNPCW
jgi:hypothetical protein